jgi:gentisate 1,2-dioxygenase
VSPANGFANRQISGFIREIPPGWKSGRHRHNMEAIIHVLEGRGYTEIDGVNFEWSAGDTISVPPMSEHQHFNLERSRRVRLFAVHTASLMSNIGSFDFIPTGNAGSIEGESV